MGSIDSDRINSWIDAVCNRPLGKARISLASDYGTAYEGLKVFDDEHRRNALSWIFLKCCQEILKKGVIENAFPVNNIAMATAGFANVDVIPPNIEGWKKALADVMGFVCTKLDEAIASGQTDFIGEKGNSRKGVRYIEVVARRKDNTQVKMHLGVELSPPGSSP